MGSLGDRVRTPAANRLPLVASLTGFDASAHLSEETRNAAWSAPIGVISSVGFSALFGFFVLMAFLFSIQDFGATVSSAYGQPVLQILVDVFGEDGALVLFTLIMGMADAPFLA